MSKSKSSPIDCLTVRSLFRYDEESGRLFWRVSSGSSKSGDEAGGIDRKGYRHMNLMGRHYQIHQLIWLYLTGSWPSGQIDHKDRDKLNNRRINLRLASNLEQQGNIKRNRRNTSGFRGVGKAKSKGVWKGKWYAQIAFKGRVLWLGTYDTPELASQAFKSKGMELFGEYFNSETSVS